MMKAISTAKTIFANICADSMFSASETMRWPSPASEEMVSPPRIARKAMMQPQPQAGQHHRESRRQHHRPEELEVVGAHRLRGADISLIDIGEAGDGVEHHRKEAIVVPIAIFEPAPRPKNKR